MKTSFSFLFIIFLLYHNEAQKVTYTFPEFQYKETNKNEIMFREVEAACQRGCFGRSGVSKILCIRQCISPSCYKELYLADLLEEGEVDVRLNSFKGCFIQRYNRSRP
ncbi:unnamed protein product [Psylliodes chrysocephalus]|uniref:Uncharacterized protein n=1 Tax=Psylliodes chrysocephalus TaxID=3402493 RepID=A0A9P0D7N1_9CUCU|nr:unnamed protein product [Psylliodes chrysocephala]